MIRQFISYISLMSVCVVCCVGCQSSQDDQETVILERFDLAMLHYGEYDDDTRASIRSQYAPCIDMVMAMRGSGVDDRSLLQYSDSRAVTMFTPDIDSAFVDVADIESVMAKILSNAKKTLPAIPHRRYFAIVSPYTTSIFADDSIMLIGLNHYMGADYRGYAGFDNYVKQNKTREKLPYDFAEALVALAYPYQPTKDETLLNRMLYEGALLEAVMQLVPEAQAAIAMGYTDDQLQWLKDNSKQAWQAIVGRQLLYSTSSADIDKMVNPAPITSLLHQEAPGRAGRYIGYCIAKAYLSQHKNAVIDELLLPTYYNSNTSLVQSKYTGENF